MLTYQEECEVRDIIAHWRSPEQMWLGSLKRALEEKRWNTEYAVPTETGYRVYSGYVLYLADAIGWASR